MLVLRKSLANRAPRDFFDKIALKYGKHIQLKYTFSSISHYSLTQRPSVYKGHIMNCLLDVYLGDRSRHLDAFKLYSPSQHFLTFHEFPLLINSCYLFLENKRYSSFLFTILTPRPFHYLPSTTCYLILPKRFLEYKHFDHL